MALCNAAENMRYFALLFVALLTDQLSGAARSPLAAQNRATPGGCEDPVDPSTQTYSALTQNYKGSNPFPVDVVIGKDGVITYIAREYDPDGITAAVEAALAK
jgi:hypothetical protein